MCHQSLDKSGEEGKAKTCTQVADMRRDKRSGDSCYSLLEKKKEKNKNLSTFDQRQSDDEE